MTRKRSITEVHTTEEEQKKLTKVCRRVSDDTDLSESVTSCVRAEESSPDRHAPPRRAVARAYVSSQGIVSAATLTAAEETTPYTAISPEPSVLNLTQLSSMDESSASDSDTAIPQAPIVKNKVSFSVVESSKLRSVSKKHSSQIWSTALAMILAVILCTRTLLLTTQPISPDSVYVTGGGFSGFWFSIGRLQSIPNPESKTYYCYSAGCMSVVAAVSNCTSNSVLDIALQVQSAWKSGSIGQHAVVTAFVDQLVATPNVQTNLLQNPALMERIKVITASPADGWFGLKSSIRSPTNSQDLSELLLQTSWIPLILGKRLWHASTKGGEYHMDGAFSYFSHPVCAHRVGLPWRLDIFANALNVNMGEHLVERFWNDGLQLGL